MTNFLSSVFRGKTRPTNCNNHFLSEKHYRQIFSRVPRLCVDLFIKTGSNTCLLGQRAHEPFKNLWAMPGGRMFFGETLTQAANRIAREEIGFKIEVAEVVGAINYLEEVAMGGRHSVSVVLSCRLREELDFLVKNDQHFKIICFDGDPETIKVLAAQKTFLTNALS